MRREIQRMLATWTGPYLYCGAESRSALSFDGVALKYLRDEDQVGVFAFSDTLRPVADYTREKRSVRQDVLRLRAGGQTALFDAMTQTLRTLSDRKGKKALIVFTDGADNASYLQSGTAIARAKKIGVPVFTIAQGDAAHESALRKLLHGIAEQTGGKSFVVKKGIGMEPVFREINELLANTYLLAYPIPSIAQPAWRTIGVTVAGLKEYKVRAREGYLVE